jgi:putative membrane protein
MLNIFKNILRGLIIGVAEIVPGVSGSTLALAMGIYDDMINFIHETLSWIRNKCFKLVYNIPHKFRKLETTHAQPPQNAKLPNFNFGLPLLTGILTINLILANLITEMINLYPNYVHAIFFGLILGSISVPWKEIKVKSKRNIMIIIAVAASMLVLTMIKPSAVITNPNPIYIFFVGIMAILAMLLPGVSGSFIMLVFGLYEYIIGSIKDFSRFSLSTDQIINLFAFCVGAIVSFSFFIKLIKVGFTKFPDVTYSILLGFIIGSLRLVFPFFEAIIINGKFTDKIIHSPFEQSANYNLWLVLILIIIGYVFVRLVEMFGSRTKLMTNHSDS